MASFKFHFIWLCLLISFGVHRGELQRRDDEVDSSTQDGSHLFKNISNKEGEGDHKDRLLQDGSNTMEIKKNCSQTIISPLDKDPNFITHWAALRTRSKDTYLGAQATINVYSLPETNGYQQTSSALILMANGVNSSPDDLNTIAAGWHVNHDLYGDYDTHFFVSWTGLGENNGCYNLKCEGFVVIPGAKYVPGTKIRPLSTYNGPQYDITLQIEKDTPSGNWFLFSGRDQDRPVGYWPKSLFTSLREYATHIQYGGAVTFYKNLRSPPMGSGHFPDEGFGKAAYIKNIKFYRHITSYPAEWEVNPSLDFFQDRPDCYKIEGDGTFYFGGQGFCFV